MKLNWCVLHRAPSHPSVKRVVRNKPASQPQGSEDTTGYWAADCLVPSPLSLFLPFPPALTRARVDGKPKTQITNLKELYFLCVFNNQEKYPHTLATQPTSACHTAP